MSQPAAQGQSFTGIVLRDDTWTLPVSLPATLLRDSDGTWQVGGRRVEGRARVTPLDPHVWTSHPWWTVLLAIVLFPIGLLALLYKVEHREPRAVLEVVAPSGHVTAIQLDAEAAHLAAAVAGT